MTQREKMEPKRKARPPKFVSLAIPGDLGEELEELKHLCQEERIRVAERQVIGRNGVMLAVLANVTQMPESERFAFVKAGVDRLKKLGIDSQAN